MSKHTPGPWEARADPNSSLPDDWCIGTGPQNIDKVAVCSKCDARLIAAAPELLEALQEMIDAHAIPSTVCNERPTYEKAMKAIAKATGGNHGL